MTGDRATCQRPGRERAFLDLITEVGGELRGFIQQRVGSGHAKDFVHQTFCLAWCSAKFDPEHTEARAWLFKTAKRLVRDWRESGESNVINLGDLSEQTADSKARDPLVELIKKVEKRILHAALAMLPDDQRDAIERYYLREEGTQIEIAAKMGISVAAFNSRLNRGRKALKRAILVLCGSDGEDGAGLMKTGGNTDILRLSILMNRLRSRTEDFGQTS
jgi:RNA polymerase sigma factor (sigma-70 family)